MTTGTQIVRPGLRGVRPASKPLRWAQLALGAGAASSTAEAGLLLFTTTNGGSERDFTHTADYWLTGVGIPAALASFVLLIALRELQDGPDARLRLTGLIINNFACLLLAAQMATSMAVGTEVRWGPSYPLATLAAFVGLSLFAAGSWRVGLLPRWMLATWPVIWVIGSMAAVGPTPLLLTAFFITMAVALTRRVLHTGLSASLAPAGGPNPSSVPGR